MTSLAVPLAQAQIDVASTLYRTLTQWVRVDHALNVLAEKFPDWSPEATLVKVATLNQLYSTNVYAVKRMAEHVAAILSADSSIPEGPALVERIAALPSAAKDQRYRHHTSFASKLAHFFISANQFAIYDAVAVQMVKYHLGRTGFQHDPTHPYHTFMGNLGRLRQYAGLTCGNRRLDRYLWLAGQYRTWCKCGDHAPINAELVQLFVSESHITQTLLAALLPVWNGKEH